MKSNSVLKAVYSALFAALVFAGTQFLRIPLPFGYFNFGDCFILLSAALLGTPHAIFASAVGAGMADVLSGYIVYAPATLLIKSLMVVVMTITVRFGKNKEKKRKIAAFAVGAALSELLMAGGYFICDWILYGLPGALASLGGNIVQGAAAVGAAIPLITAFEHSGRFKHIKF